MTELLESYNEFLNEGAMKFTHFGVNFLVTSKIDAGSRQAKYNFLPSTMKDVESINNKEKFAKTIEVYLKKKTGLKFEYNSADPAAGLTFMVYLSELEDIMLKVLE